MTLPTLWFLIVAFLWTGFFVLEGFDFGVGMLHKVVGRTDTEQRVAINAIGPFWDGNEVWLVVGGAAIFAAFPGWYATWFSAMYLALVLLLVALMARGVSFEFRGHVDAHRWRQTWSWCLAVGSLLSPLLLGVALGNLLAGLPVGSDEEFTGTVADLVTGYGLLVGVTLVALCVLHGATFLALRTDGPVRERSHRVAAAVVLPTALLLLGFAAWTPTLSDAPVVRSVLPPLVALAAVLAAGLLVRARREGWAFGATAVAIGLTVVSLFANLYPDVLVSSTDPADSLTVDGTASGTYALQVMSVVALVLVPVVLLYQGWTYHVFRRRVSGPPADAAPDPAPGPPAPLDEGAVR
ncbi:cytochrome d ubiquinol oxidase subunit II [Cellulomonas biazotea]|uniref:Cytochrome c oxidase assembly protein n=1 Tax=Cellulomonas biazotea TaxID=1709 RepID=A0A402DUR2_9CELL|nr:cytochrome d ubiquinol oxidase subunit II [Cellulomonas biazotea]GCE77881.1 cytochrome c oxidase assembly protein [Cellulomonas biazotea]